MADNKSIQSVYMSLRGSLARSVLGIVPPVEIEDIVQETYVRVCKIERMEEIRKPRSFLYKTARNIALDHAKRAETRLTTSFDDDVSASIYGVKKEDDETLEQVASDEEFSQFCEAVRHLPVQCRRVFVLKKVYGYSQREISRELDLSESTVEKHVAQGIKRCSGFMMQHNYQGRRPKSIQESQREINKSASHRGGNL